MGKRGKFHKRLKWLIVQYILQGYKILKKFPKEERYEITSQGRRALVSILLNYVEGYARSKKKVMLNSYEISYGSLQEANCVFFLGVQLGYMSKEDYLKLFKIKEEIAKIEWSTIEGLRTEVGYKN